MRSRISWRRPHRLSKMYRGNNLLGCQSSLMCCRCSQSMVKLSLNLKPSSSRDIFLKKSSQLLYGTIFSRLPSQKLMTLKRKRKRPHAKTGISKKSNPSQKPLSKKLLKSSSTLTQASRKKHNCLPTSKQYTSNRTPTTTQQTNKATTRCLRMSLDHHLCPRTRSASQ